jgi:hypothetical protein
MVLRNLRIRLKAASKQSSIMTQLKVRAKEDFWAWLKVDASQKNVYNMACLSRHQSLQIFEIERWFPNLGFGI